MKKIKYALIILFLMFTSTALAAMDIKESDWPYFQSVIKMNNYVCDTCEGGYALEKTHRGMEFSVYCNDNSLKYKVTITPNGIPIVEPW